MFEDFVKLVPKGLKIVDFNKFSIVYRSFYCKVQRFPTNIRLDEDVFKTSSRRFEDVLKNVFKTSSRRL